MKPIYKKLLALCGALILFIVLLHITGIRHYVSLEHVKVHSGFLAHVVQRNYVMALFLYMVIYTGVVAASLPVTGPLGIAAGFMFGFFPGLLYSLIAGLVGSIIAFSVLKRMTQRLRSAELSPRMAVLKQRLDHYGYIYLLMLHFTIITPFIVINTLAALAGISYKTFVWVTGVGMIPAAAVYVFAGTQLASIESIKDLFSWPVIFALVLLILMLIVPIFLQRRKKENV